MSDSSITGLPAAPPQGDAVRAAIARAAQRTGMDFQYLLAQAKLESRLDPGAKAPTSSAAGLYQFTRGTWLQTLDRHGAEHGLGWAGEAISGGRVTDPAMTSRIMALRYDADASALMAAELASDNRDDLAAHLGREPDAAELYLGHFLGSGGARTFLSALRDNPGMSAASLMPRAAAANRTIFYERSGAPRSVSGMMDLIRGKVERAMEAGGPPPVWAAAPSVQPTTAAQAFAQAAPVRAVEAARNEHRPMSATLAQAFGSVSPTGNAPASVRAAYDKLARFGL
ncbi:MAG: lytic transglycosylase domain-containing protein [Sphingomonadaceae bacterium]